MNMGFVFLFVFALLLALLALYYLLYFFITTRRSKFIAQLRFSFVQICFLATILSTPLSPPPPPPLTPRSPAALLHGHFPAFF